MELPVSNPSLIECIDDQSTITVNFYMARYFQCFQLLYHSLHLHPVIGRQLFPSRKFLTPFSALQVHFPSARTGFSTACPIGLEKPEWFHTNFVCRPLLIVSHMYCI